MSPMYGYTDAQLLRKENTALRSQVERYREVVTFALGVLRSSTMTWEQRGAVTYDALARLDADPPRDRQECAFCKGAGNVAAARVVGRKVFHDERPCPKCGGSGLAPADPPREPTERNEG